MNLSSTAKSEIGRSDYCMYRHPRQSSLENIVHHLAQETKKLYMYVRYFFRQSSKFVEDSVKVFHRTLFVKTIDYSPNQFYGKKIQSSTMFKLVKKDVKSIPPNVCTILIQQPWLTARRDWQHHYICTLFVNSKGNACENKRGTATQTSILESI